jgi:hypothetical protein
MTLSTFGTFQKSQTFTFFQKVKVGKFSPYAPRDQQLSLSDEMIVWATGITEVDWI